MEIAKVEKLERKREPETFGELSKKAFFSC